MIFLTQQESDKFADWLEQEVQSNLQFIKLMADSPGGELFGTHKKRECAAYLIVARNLRSTERMILDGDAKGEENGG